MAIDKLTDDAITEHLTKLPGWSLEAGAIVKTYQFDDFVAAMGFVNALAEAAEAVKHHPDIDIRYSKVKIALSTHDAGGITDMDIQLAATADGFAP